MHKKLSEKSAVNFSIDTTPTQSIWQISPLRIENGESATPVLVLPIFYQHTDFSQTKLRFKICKSKQADYLETRRGIQEAKKLAKELAEQTRAYEQSGTIISFRTPLAAEFHHYV